MGLAIKKENHVLAKFSATATFPRLCALKVQSFINVVIAIQNNYLARIKVSRIQNGTFPSVLECLAKTSKLRTLGRSVTIFQRRVLGISLQDLSKDGRLYLMTINPMAYPTLKSDIGKRRAESQQGALHTAGEWCSPGLEDPARRSNSLPTFCLDIYWVGKLRPYRCCASQEELLMYPGAWKHSWTKVWSLLNQEGRKLAGATLDGRWRWRQKWFGVNFHCSAHWRCMNVHGWYPHPSILMSPPEKGACWVGGTSLVTSYEETMRRQGLILENGEGWVARG